MIDQGTVGVHVRWLRTKMETHSADAKRLVAAARLVARNELGARVTDAPRGELGELTQVFESAVDRRQRLLESSQREARRYAAHTRNQVFNQAVLAPVSSMWSAMGRAVGTSPGRLE